MLVSLYYISMKVTRLFSIAVLIAFIAAFLIPSPLHGQDDNIVRRDGAGLILNGKSFFFSSSNQYCLFYKPQGMIDEIFDDAAALGMKVFRAWASCEGIYKDGYCFQPAAGSYDEATFQKLDYIVYKAGQNGIKLILPFVNNWDDYFGGMPQYTKWSVSAKSDLYMDIYNPGAPCQAAIAMRTGDGWDWHESEKITLESGWNNISVFPRSPVWMCAANGWTFSSPVANLYNVKQLDILVYTSNNTGSIYVDNIRLGPSGRPILWDDAETLDNEPLHSPELGLWRPEGGNDATGASISSSYHTEGWYSLKLDFNQALPNGKAIWKKDTGMGNHDVFFFDTDCKTLYKNYINYVLNRTNSITGVQYKNDPAILVWELANEPRCESDVSGDTFQSWVEEMSAFIKVIDLNHLVSVGSEGWYAGETGWQSGRGTDFIRNNQSPGIDICTSHLFPNDNGMVEADCPTWLTRRISDAKNVIQKPFYLGEFGWRVDRNAGPADAAIHDFAAGIDGWHIAWGFDAGPTWVENPNSGGIGAIEYTANFFHGKVVAGEVLYDTPRDYSQYEYISAWVMTPPCPSGTHLQMQLYVKTGLGSNPPYIFSSIWTQGYLNPSTWYQVKIALSQIAAEGDPAKIRAIGFQIKSWNTSYGGMVFLDRIEAIGGGNNSEEQMADRNRIYNDWYNIALNQDTQGAGFWLLSGHNPDGSLYNPEDTYSVYYDEDAGTRSVVQSFSSAMNSKGITINIPALEAAKEGVLFQFPVNSENSSGRSVSFTASGLPSGAQLTDNGDNSAIFNWTPVYTHARIEPYAFTIEATDGVYKAKREISITVENTIAFGTIYEVDGASQIPLAGAAVSILNIDRTPTSVAPAETNAQGKFVVTGSLPDGNYIIKTIKETYNTYSGIMIIRSSMALPFTARLYHPQFTSAPDITVNEGSTASSYITASDANNDKLGFSLRDILLESQFIDNGNGTATLSVSPRYNQAGLYPVTINVTDGLFEESATVMVNVINTPVADLSVSSLRCLSVGSLARFPAVIVAAIQNRGDKASGSFTVSLDDNGVTVQSRTIGNLKSGQKMMQIFFLTVKRGEHTITVKADPKALVQESDETNNSMSVSIFLR